MKEKRKYFEPVAQLVMLEKADMLTAISNNGDNLIGDGDVPDINITV